MNTKTKLFTISMLLAILMTMVVFATNQVAFDNTGNTIDNAPDGIKVYNLHTANTVAANDTFATTEANYYGPFDAASDGGSVATSFQLVADVITGTTPTMSLGYQFNVWPEITDTTVWTEIDTLAATAQNELKTISGLGNYIWFRVYNFDGTACQIPGRLRIILTPSTTIYKERK